MEVIYWECFFNNAGINGDTSKDYASIFVKNKISDTLLIHLNESHLKSMGIEAIGDIIRILKYSKEFIEQKKTPSRSIKEIKERVVEIVPKNVESDEEKKPAKKLSITSTYSKPAGCELPVPVKRIVNPEIEGKYKVKYPMKANVITEHQSNKETETLKSGTTSHRTVILNDVPPPMTVNRKISVLKRLGQSTDKYSISSSSEDEVDKTNISKNKLMNMDGKITTSNRFANVASLANAPVAGQTPKKLKLHKTSERSVFARLGDSPQNEDAGTHIRIKNRESPSNRSVSGDTCLDKRVKVRSGHTTENLHKMEATSTTEFGSLRSDSIGGRPQSRNVMTRLGQKW